MSHRVPSEALLCLQEAKVLAQVLQGGTEGQVNTNTARIAQDTRRESIVPRHRDPIVQPHRPHPFASPTEPPNTKAGSSRMRETLRVLLNESDEARPASEIWRQESCDEDAHSSRTRAALNALEQTQGEESGIAPHSRCAPTSSSERSAKIERSVPTFGLKSRQTAFRRCLRAIRGERVPPGRR